MSYGWPFESRVQPVDVIWCDTLIQMLATELKGIDFRMHIQELSAWGIHLFLGGIEIWGPCRSISRRWSAKINALKWRLRSNRRIQLESVSILAWIPFTCNVWKLLAPRPIACCEDVYLFHPQHMHNFIHIWHIGFSFTWLARYSIVRVSLSVSWAIYQITT